jgi:hypothetical protein
MSDGDKLPKAVWSGVFTIWGIDLHCHVLDDGQRVIDVDDFHKFINAMADGVPMADDPDLMAFLKWQKGQNQ